MNPRGLSRPALETLVIEQEKELTLLRGRLAEAEGARERADAAARSAWQFARTMIRRQ